MSRKPKYVELTHEMVMRQKRIIETLCRIALGTSSLADSEAMDELGRVFRFVEGGNFGGVKVPPLSYLPVYLPHVEKALRARNIPLAACLTLSMYFVHEYEAHMPAYGQRILDAVNRGKKNAAARASEEDNARTRIEAWERENHALAPTSRDTEIAACARDIERSEVTVRNALRARARAAQD